MKRTFKSSWIVAFTLLLFEFNSLYAQNAPCGSTQSLNGGSITFSSIPNGSTCTITINLNPGETFTINGGGGIIAYGGNANTGLSLVVNGGTLIINADITVSGNADFSVSGVGSVILEGTYTMTGSGNSDFSVDGNITMNGSVDLGNNGDLTVGGSGDIDINGTLTVGSNGDVQVDGNLEADVIDNSSGGTVTDNGGTGTINSGTCTGACTDVGTPTPIQLSSFQLNPLGDDAIRISWVTAAEVNNEYFTVERSLNGVDFESIGTVAGAGNSNSPLSYQFTDRPQYHGILYYRLKQTDFDGAYETFQILRVNTLEQGSMRSLAFSPTITAPSSIVSTRNVWGQIFEINLSLLSLSGKQFPISNLQITEDRLTFSLPNSLSNDLYILKGTINGVAVTTKLIVK